MRPGAIGQGRSGVALILLIGVSGCGAKSIRHLSGVTGVRSAGPVLTIETTVREPANALDAPVAIGQAVALVGRRIRKGARDVPTGVRDVVMHVSLIAPEGPGREVPSPALSLSFPISRARATVWPDLVAQQALDIVTAIPEATPGATAINRTYCADAAHAALSAAYCRLVATGSPSPNGWSAALAPPAAHPGVARPVA